MSIAQAAIGHNNPPEKTVFEAHEANIDDLFEEAKVWFDGSVVQTQQEADAVNTLITRTRSAEKAADDERKKEVAPFDKSKKEVQDRYNTLIGNTKAITGKTVAIVRAAKISLEPFLQKLRAEQEAKAKAEREEADRKQREAMEAMQQRNAGNLEQSIAAEKLVDEAKKADAQAVRAAKQKAHAKGEGRATALRSVWRAHMVDKKEAAKWAMNNHTDEFLTFAQTKADQDVRAGTRAIAGFNVVEEKVL